MQGLITMRSQKQTGRKKIQPVISVPADLFRDEKARAILEDYLQSIRNFNLKLERIGDKGGAFESRALIRNDSLGNRILVDKNMGL
jgi:hypothetical protein